MTLNLKKEQFVKSLNEGYSVGQLSARLSVSANSLYKWVRAVKPDKTDHQANYLIATEIAP